MLNQTMMDVLASYYTLCITLTLKHTEQAHFPLQYSTASLFICVRLLVYNLISLIGDSLLVLPHMLCLIYPLFIILRLF